MIIKGNIAAKLGEYHILKDNFLNVNIKSAGTASFICWKEEKKVIIYRGLRIY